ncbi:MAG: DUF6624 domain-containing protein [Candidatus Vogelbacteria bacterium]
MEMLKRDQRIRREQQKKFFALNKMFPDKKSQNYKKEIGKLVKELTSLDRKHTNKVKKIIDKYGWPGKSLVGKQGAHGAWLLVQHATHDVDFQKNCLKLLKKAVKINQAERKHIAFLTDRILILQKKKQIFGTQFRRNKDNQLESFPIKDEGKIDLMREKMGLESLSKYKKKMKTLS